MFNFYYHQFTYMVAVFMNFFRFYRNSHYVPTSGCELCMQLYVSIGVGDI